MERFKVTLSTKKEGATAIATNLVMHKRKVIYMTAFGPTEEIRAFRQLLKDTSDLEIKDKDSNRVDSHYGITTFHPVWIKGELANHRMLYVVPSDTSFIIADTREQCREIFYRILSQKEFVHPDWFQGLFDLLPEIEPVFGTCRCFVNDLNIEKEVLKGVAEGTFAFPAPTAELTLEEKTKEAA